MSAPDSNAVIAASVFLLTYLLHSTIAVALTGALIPAMRRWAHPEFRVLIWKVVLLLPIGTAVGVAFLEQPHFGLQVQLGGIGESEFEGNVISASMSDGLVKSDVIPSSAEFSSGESISEFTAAPISTPREATDSHAAYDSFDVPMHSQFPGYLFVLWTVGAGLGTISLLFHVRSLQRLRHRAVEVTSGEILAALNRIRTRLGIRRCVQLLVSDELTGPVAGGIARPCVLLPGSMASMSTNGEELSIAERDALLAHELTHIARGDASWSLIIQVVSRIFFIQPLNAFAGHQLRKEMDFVADLHAAIVLGQRTGLADCLLRLASQMQSLQPSGGQFAFTAGMASFRSTLGQRIEALLDPNNELREFGHRRRLASVVLLTACSVVVSSIIPCAVAQPPNNSETHTSTRTETSTMKSQAGTLALLTAMVMPVAADEPQTKANSGSPSQAALRTTPDELPAGIRRFNGMLVGRIAAKDIERGTFVVNVDTVSRVWRNSQSENPQSVVGKAVEVGGVSGKWLDVLVTTRTGETIEFECQHDGDVLRFPGELLRKVAPYKAENYPRLPEEFRGFQGVIVADIVKKDSESFELMVKVSEVSKVWPASKARQPDSIKGQSMLLAGFWNRREVYQSLKPGDRIEAGIQHISRQSDHVNVHEFVRKAGEAESEKMERMTESRESGGATGNGIKGFRGMLVGRLVKKDVERGTFTITVDAVTRVWNNNKSRNPKSLVGQDVDATGTQGKLLDTLVVARVGETIEFGALHDGEDELRVGEVLRKVAPVKPGDYPQIPDAARGISGMLTAKVVKKDQELWGLVVEVKNIDETFPKNRAKDAQSLVGKPVMLGGFWNRKDAYQSLKIGDTIRFGVNHEQPLSDALSVIESVRKVDAE